MLKTRTFGIGVGAIIAVALTAMPASAYWITGWQTNSGYNNIDGAIVRRDIYSDHVTAKDGVYARDVGVRAKGYRSDGSYYEFATPNWHSWFAWQNIYNPSHSVAIKVYHGDH